MKAVIFISILLSLAVYSCGSVQGQEQIRDYFVAVEDAEDVQRYLDLVEKHHLNKVLGFIREDKLVYALGEIKWTLDRFPNHPRAFSLLEVVAQLAQVNDLPVVYYERAIKEYPQHGITHAQYGKYLVDIGKGEQGIIHLKHAIKLSPKLVPAHVWLAESYNKLGKKELARQSAEQARALGYKGE